jgi:hypothetical protein
VIGARFVLLTLALPLLGSYARRFGNVRALPLAARIPVYFATGLFTIVAEMFVLSAFGVRWSAALLVPLPLVLAIAAGYRLPVASGVSPEGKAPGHRSPVTGNAFLTGHRSPVTGNAFLIPTAAALLILLSAVLAGALTSGDYVIFWGTKGQRFGQTHMLDYAFTLDPNHYMHPDYPPLVPFFYAWTMLGGDGAFDWWGGILSAPMFLGLGAAAMWGFGRYAGIRVAGPMAALFASSYALFYIRNAVAGNAEPALHFFELIALCALTCWRDRPNEHNAIAAIALAAVTLTKVEGGVFVAIVLTLTCLSRARWKLGFLPVITLSSWLLFGYVHGLTDTYVPRDDLSIKYLVPTARELVKELALRLHYTPWIAAAIVLLTGRARRGIPYILASLGFTAFLLSVYTRAEPHLDWSAGRTLMTPLLLFYFAAVNAHRAAHRPDVTSSSPAAGPYTPASAR